MTSKIYNHDNGTKGATVGSTYGSGVTYGSDTGRPGGPSPEKISLIRYLLVGSVLLLVVGIILFVYVFQTSKRTGDRLDSMASTELPIMIMTTAVTDSRSDPTAGPTDPTAGPIDPTTEPPQQNPDLITSFTGLQEFYYGHLDDNCGLRHFAPGSRSSPWNIEVYAEKAFRYEYVCSAALVSPNWLLTTKECGIEIRDTLIRHWAVGGHQTRHEANTWLGSKPSRSGKRLQRITTTVRVVQSLSLARLAARFSVPILEQEGNQTVILINTICLPPPVLPQPSSLSTIYELLGFERGDDFRPSVEIGLNKADLNIDQEQSIFPDDRLRLSGAPVKEVCKIGHHGSPLFSAVRMFGRTDRVRVYLDAIIDTVSDNKCRDEQLVAFFWNVSITAPSIKSVWKRYAT